LELAVRPSASAACWAADCKGYASGRRKR
jgi:hypothetical protein